MQHEPTGHERVLPVEPAGVLFLPEPLEPVVLRRLAQTSGMMTSCPKAPMAEKLASPVFQVRAAAGPRQEQKRADAEQAVEEQVVGPQHDVAHLERLWHLALLARRRRHGLQDDRQDVMAWSMPAGRGPYAERVIVARTAGLMQEPRLVGPDAPPDLMQRDLAQLGLPQLGLELQSLAALGLIWWGPVHSLLVELRGFHPNRPRGQYPARAGYAAHP